MRARATIASAALALIPIGLTGALALGTTAQSQQTVREVDMGTTSGYHAFDDALRGA